MIPFKDERDAITIANDTPYGLAAYVQTDDMVRARRVARLLRAGGQVSLQSIVSNVEVLQSLPDETAKPSVTTSLQKIQRKSSTNAPRSAKLSDSVFVTLAPSIDSVDAQFWKTAALLEYTPKEDSLYRATDSVSRSLMARGRRTTTQIFDSTITVVEEALAAQQSSVPYLTPLSLFRFPLGTSATIGFSPILMQPRVTGRVYGIETALDWRPSPGLHRHNRTDRRRRLDIPLCLRRR